MFRGWVDLNAPRTPCIKIVCYIAKMMLNLATIFVSSLLGLCVLILCLEVIGLFVVLELLLQIDLPTIVLGLIQIGRWYILTLRLDVVLLIVVDMSILHLRNSLSTIF